MLPRNLATKILQIATVQQTPLHRKLATNAAFSAPVTNLVSSDKVAPSLIPISSVAQFSDIKNHTWRTPYLHSFISSFSSGETLGLVNLDRSVFGSTPRQDLLARALRYEKSWREQGTESTKNLGQVRGSTRKPFQQKGRGKARVGTVRAPQWRGGYIVHGPRPHDKTTDLPRKVYNGAIRSALSAKYLQNQLLVVDSLTIPSSLKAALWGPMESNNLLQKKVYFLYGDEEPEECLVKASEKFWKRDARPDKGLGPEKQILVSSARNVTVNPLLENEIVVLDKKALEVLEEMYHVE
ncbi:54S ribosomal protein L4 mitochondrial [Thoreauomyces humboldtii]|nr:54S ribosomal protein L4 mitochondrial [Thoreauomyces humboldtii]